MRRVPLLLLALCAPSAGAVEWRLIDLKARLDGDGRLHVVETHLMRVDKGGFSLFREFGLGADQAIVFKGLTRVDADGSEHPLAEGEVDGPNRYRYYDRGHAYFRLPELKDGGDVAFRFDYDLVNAVGPAWGIAAGPEALLEEIQFVSPWTRIQALLADWREAWPDPGRRPRPGVRTFGWRLDHDVLYPSRQGPGFVVSRIEYRLEHDRVWTRVHPEAELATVKPDDHYRVRPLLEYTGPGRPAAAAWREAALRLGAVASLPVVGLLLWLLLLAVEAVSVRASGPVDRAFIAERLLPLAPEVVAAVCGRVGSWPAETVLSRLATERKIAIEVGPMPEEDPPDVRMRLLVPRTALPAFERDLIEELFPKGDETGSALLSEVYGKEGLDPGAVVRGLLSAVPPPAAPPHGFLPAAVLVLAGILGFVMQVRAVAGADYLLIVVLANAAALALALAWPKGWWYEGQEKRGLLVPFALMTTGYLGLNLAVNRPLPANAWVGGALVVLACHASILASSRMRTGGRYTLPRHLTRIRRFATAELRRPRPRLEDEWIPRLRGLGLDPQIEAWRARYGGTAQAPVDLASAGAGEDLAGPRFTGRVPAPFVGPPGWTDGLFVYAEEDEGDEKET